MSIVFFNATEAAAWDQYFAAALPLAKAQADLTENSMEKQWDNVFKEAAHFADKMIEERRNRT